MPFSPQPIWPCERIFELEFYCRRQTNSLHFMQKTSVRKKEISAMGFSRKIAFIADTFEDFLALNVRSHIVYVVWKFYWISFV